MRNSLRRMWLVLFSVVLLTACSVLPCAAKPQDSQTQQGQSVADAARHSREQRKKVARQSRVISNEDLDTEYFKPGQQGLNLGAPPRLKTEPPSASGIGAADAANQAATSANRESRKDKNSDEAAALDTEIARLKNQIAEAEDRLKWQQRELALDQDIVYSNPNYTDFKTGKAKLDSEQQEINQRREEIEALKASLAALQERRKQVAPPESTPPGPIATDRYRRQFYSIRERRRQSTRDNLVGARVSVNTDSGAS